MTRLVDSECLILALILNDVGAGFMRVNHGEDITAWEALGTETVAFNLDSACVIPEKNHPAGMSKKVAFAYWANPKERQAKRYVHMIHAHVAYVLFHLLENSFFHYGGSKVKQGHGICRGVNRGESVLRMVLVYYERAAVRASIRCLQECPKCDIRQLVCWLICSPRTLLLPVVLARVAGTVFASLLSDRALRLRERMRR